MTAGYAFSEGAGTSTADASGGGSNGTSAGATWTAGRTGNGLSFNGTSSYVDLGNPASLQFTSSLTLSAWVYETANVGDDGIIVARSSGAAGWELKSSPDMGVRNFAIGVYGSAGYIGRYSTTVRSLNTWYHVTGVYDASARTLDIYVNGVLDNGSLLGTVPASLVNPGLNANIGRRTGGFYIKGTLDDVRIYDRALAPAEVVSDMGTALDGTPADGVAPSVPTNLTATAVSSSQVNLSWTASSDNTAVAGYAIFRDGLQVGTSTTASYSDTGRAPTTTYSYTVAAYDAVGNRSAQSGAATATTLPSAFDFSLSTQGNKSVVSGTSVTNVVTSTLVTAPTAVVSFTAAGLPAGATAMFNPTSCSPTCSSTMTVSTIGTTPSGTFPVTVTGTSGAVVHTAAFNLTVTSTSDTTPPTVSLTAPAANAFVAGTSVTVSASASDNISVAGVQFLLDGAALGAEDTTSPYSVTWNSTTATAGSHTLTRACP